jgi:hypothetical protein
VGVKPAKRTFVTAAPFSVSVAASSEAARVVEGDAVPEGTF